jgi:hypothetical protein
MNRLLLGVLILAFLLSPIAQAKGPSPTPYTQQAEPNEADLQLHRHYKNKDGQDVHSPSKSNSGKVPQGASAQCRDGTYSFSHHRSGTCSRHGGVAAWVQ